MYTDDNGLVYFENTDSVAPLHSTLNTLTSSVSGALDGDLRTVRVADRQARDDLFGEVGAPLSVFREDISVVQHNFGEGWQADTSFRRVVTDASAVFASTVSGVSVDSVQGLYEYYEGEPFGWFMVRFRVSGLSLSSGNHSQSNGEFGRLTSTYMPTGATPFAGYFASGTAQGSVTGSGLMAVRYMSATSSAQKYFYMSYAVEV